MAQKIQKILFTLVCCALTVCSISSCSKEKKDIPTPTQETERTILVYMVATNSLGKYSCDVTDLAEMEETIAKSETNNCRLLVYWSLYNSSPRLFEITKSGNKAVRKTIKTYNDVNSSVSVRQFSQVLSDVVKEAPAKEYGLVLWSHATGWARSLKEVNTSKLRDFGDDRGQTMPIDSLANAMPNNMFKFIYTDACYMACVEVAYELRNKTQYFVGSTTELPLDGMPYTQNIPCMMQATPDLKQCCINTYNYYNALSGDDQTCTISLIDCTKLDELAKVCHDIYHSSNNKDVDYTTIQRYKEYRPYLFFDLQQYYNALADDNLEQRLDQVLNNVVIYKAATTYIFTSLYINPNYYCGLSSYITNSPAGTLNQEYYKTLSWYRDVIQ